MPKDDQAGRRWSSVTAGVHAVLVHRRLPIVAALVAIALVLPSLSGGWATDDYYHQFAILAPGNAREICRSFFKQKTAYEILA